MVWSHWLTMLTLKSLTSISQLDSLTIVWYPVQSTVFASNFKSTEIYETSLLQVLIFTFTFIEEGMLLPFFSANEKYKPVKLLSFEILTLELPNSYTSGLRFLFSVLLKRTTISFSSTLVAILS